VRQSSPLKNAGDEGSKQCSEWMRATPAEDKRTHLDSIGALDGREWNPIAGAKPKRPTFVFAMYCERRRKNASQFSNNSDWGSKLLAAAGRKPRHSARGFPESIGTLSDMGLGPHVSSMKSTAATAPGGKVCLAIGFVQRFYLIVHEEVGLSI
jgi:hypothetical protein